MKKLNVFILSLLVMFFAACKSNNTDTNAVKPECSVCKTMSPDYEFNIKIADHEIPFQLWEGAAKSIMDKTYLLGLPNKYILSAEESRKLLSQLSLESANGILAENIMTYALYTNIDFSGRAIEEKDIVGSAIYYVVNGALNVAIFRKSSGAMVRMPELDATVRTMPILDFYKISTIIKGDNKNITALVLSTDNYNKLETKAIMKKSGNTLSHKLNTYFNHNSNYNLKASKELNSTLSIVVLEHKNNVPDFGCAGFPCEGGSGSCSYSPGDGPPICIDCSEEEMYKTGGKPTNPDIQTKLYNFRDNFLAISVVGQHFIDDYYYCGTEVKAILTPTTAARGVTLLVNDVMPMVEKLTAAEAATDNTILLTADKAAELIDFVTELKSGSTDETFVEIMNELIDNLSYASGKSVSTIYSDFAPVSSD